MAPLIDDVLSLEQEADEIVAKAQTQAKQADMRADDDIGALREEIAGRLDARIAAYRIEAERRHETDAAKTSEETRAAAASVDAVGADIVAKQADRVVARFGEM